MHVVCAWIGNSAAVAAKHYLQVTDEHFEQAAQKRGAEPAQQASRTSRTESTKRQQRSRDCRGMRRCVPVLQLVQVGDEGLEPPTSTV